MRMHWAALGFRKNLVNLKKLYPLTSLVHASASAGTGTTKFRACGAQGF
jgi:hypothetical protein